jgi:methionyl-tRNA formyltransferase
MRIAFFGSPEYAVPSLRALLDLPEVEVTAVVTQPDRPRGRSSRLRETPVKELAVEAGVGTILQPERVRRATTEALTSLGVEAGVVAASGHILPQHLLDAIPLGLLNVHASLLPRHRGASPIAAAILEGDAEGGVTLMRVVREVDAGPIVASRATPIEPRDTTGTLTDRIAELGAQLLAETLPRWLRGELTERPQDESLATYAPRLEKADGVLEWSQPAEALWRRVRAFQPWPIATTAYQGERLSIHEAWPIALDHAAPPGTVVAGDGSALDGPLADRAAQAVVACGEGGLVLLRIQRSGKPARDIEDYLNGDRGFIGAQLG